MKDHIPERPERSLQMLNSFLKGLYGIWSSMKMTLQLCINHNLVANQCHDDRPSEQKYILIISTCVTNRGTCLQIRSVFTFSLICSSVFGARVLVRAVMFLVEFQSAVMTLW